MNCYRCNEEAVLSSANHKNFYYCRNCKKEVYENEFDDPDIKQEMKEYENSLTDEGGIISVDPTDEYGDAGDLFDTGYHTFGTGKGYT